MAAKDYKLGVGNFGSVYIAKTSKKDPRQMTTDRAVVSKSEFIAAILEWVITQIEEDSGTLSITTEGKTVAEIKIFRDKLMKGV